MLLADDGSQRLAPATVEVESGELVAILGPAGAGKTTLMNVRAVLVRPSAGHGTVGGQDLAAAASELAYVPQDDIVHRDLTPREALTFAAGLRLPPDHGRAEIRSVVDRLLTRLDLDDCADRVIHNVSGGQRKRASAAMELVGDPRLLFMDEPAAGLDAGHDRDHMALLGQRADDGRAVVLTTHNTWHLSMCDRLLLVGRGGVLRYDGRPDGVEAHFGVETFTDVYDALDVAPTEPVAAVPPAPRPAEEATRRRSRVVGRHVRTLTHRNLRILTRDGRGLLTALLAAPAMAALAVALFGGEALRRGAGSPFDDVNLLLALALVATWLGAFAGLRAIVTEALAWRRESSIGVAPLSYLIGKWLVHGALVIVQAALIAVAAFGAAGTDLPRHTLVVLAVTIAATALAGLSAGLAVSAVSRTEARAITLVLPYVVLQFFFAGVVVPVGDMGVLRWLSEITSARWGVAGLGSATHLGEPPTPTFSDKYGDGFFSASPATYLGAIAAIAVATALLTLLYVRRAGASRA
jgi:ABC-type multidrug transport system ATPase subunit/ABC-type multidrug transport system permease subunit